MKRPTKERVLELARDYVTKRRTWIEYSLPEAGSPEFAASHRECERLKSKFDNAADQLAIMVALDLLGSEALDCKRVELRTAGGAS